MWPIKNFQVETVSVVDDDPTSRESLGWVLADSDLNSFPLNGPLRDVPNTCQVIVNGAQALICDHHLSGRNYAGFAGADLVAATFKMGFLSVLCTRYIRVEIEGIRHLLPYIPVIRTPDELNEPEELRGALKDCASELAGDVAPDRRSWRTQLVVERIEGTTFDVSLPAWEIEESVRLRLQDVPLALRPDIKVGFRVYVKANIGAQDSDRLFVSEWSE